MSLATPAPHHRALHLKLDQFEGPLDLLLHLVRARDQAVTELVLADITAEYLAFLEGLADDELEAAGDYLLMAATLIHMKSRALLPKRQEEAPDDDLDGEGMDPHEALMARLRELERFQAAGAWLGGRAVSGADRFFRPSRAQEYFDASGPGELVEVGVYQLIRALARLAEEKNRAEMLHEVTPQRLSMRSCLLGVIEFLKSRPRTNFRELTRSMYPQGRRQEQVALFLALLELARSRVITLFQSTLTAEGLIIERSVLESQELNLTLDPQFD